jgi:hypothetical protein
MVSSVEFIIQSLELATNEGSEHLSVGAGGRGGVLLIPVDTDIPVAIHPTNATPLMQLKIAPYRKFKLNCTIQTEKVFYFLNQLPD